MTNMFQNKTEDLHSRSKSAWFFDAVVLRRQAKFISLVETTEILKFAKKTENPLEELKSDAWISQPRPVVLVPLKASIPRFAAVVVAVTLNFRWQLELRRSLDPRITYLALVPPSSHSLHPKLCTASELGPAFIGSGVHLNWIYRRHKS
jgi:hypothetical protein